ncbi:MAG TPA: serine hydrolase domain-containing protein [Solirubrobacteraceae bacterium]|nr:serine hydrolase domain-containing protein [Solirubrobacteraceae bacterium]
MSNHTHISQASPVARRRIAASVLAAVALLVSPAVASAARDVGPAAPRPVLVQRMEQTVAAGAPGIVTLINDGSNVGEPWTAARGVADVRTQRPMRATDHFRIGSVTKSFVATVALQLVDEGRLSLSDTVEQWLPGILPYGDKVTLRELLNHTSGIPDALFVTRELIYSGDPFRTWSPREIVALIAGEPQLFPSGSAYYYSSTNTVLAGLIIEQATGHPLGDEIERRIIRPLHLRDTSFPVIDPSIASPSARGYSLAHDDQGNPIEGPLLDVTDYNPSGAWAAGNMISNVEDIARFYRALLGGRLLSPARLADMKTTVDVGPGERYGLGLDVLDTPCGPLYGHTGGVPGFVNAAFSNEDGTRQLGIMMNAQEWPAAVGEPFNLTSQQAVREAFAGAPQCAGADQRAALARAAR